MKGSLQVQTYQFTIQNVPIKSQTRAETRQVLRNLQYKMFLLNLIQGKLDISEYQFTIQNVPIKCKRYRSEILNKLHLQYKMFLLNKKC